MSEIIDYLNKPPQRYASYLGGMVESSEGEYVKFADMDLYMFEGGELMQQSIVRCTALTEALSGLIGLVQLLSHNEDIPAEIRAHMTENHRFKAAQACFPATKWEDFGLTAPSDGVEHG